MPDNAPQRFVQAGIDRTMDPPRYLDYDLPTSTKKFQGAVKRVFTRAPFGTILGSMRLTGSHYDLGLGSYSLRVTRRHVYIGTPNMAWHIRHSRQGTVDVLTTPTPRAADVTPQWYGNFEALGNQEHPVYSFGPGTITWGFTPLAGQVIGSAYPLIQSMEGVIGVKRPDE